MTNKGPFCVGGCGRKKSAVNRHYAPGCNGMRCMKNKRMDAKPDKEFAGELRRSPDR